MFVGKFTDPAFADGIPAIAPTQTSISATNAGPTFLKLVSILVTKQDGFDLRIKRNL
jgi:hypothetical protein